MTAPISLAPEALDYLMPLHLRLDPDGRIAGVGPTLAKLATDKPLVGEGFFAAFDLRRPAGVTSMAELTKRAGQRLQLSLRGAVPALSFRGLALPTAAGQGMLLNLSFGIGVIEAVRNHVLTDADFSPTDLAVEMLYLVEAKSAVMEELRSLNQRLQGAKLAAETQALTDTLTGLRNRRALDLMLVELTRNRATFGLMHIDLDFFKAVNDTLGHAAGDHVLRAVATLLKQESRAEDLVARVGGDEFVIIFPGLTEAADLGAVAHRIIHALTQPIDFEGKTCRVSASIGVTMSTYYDHPDADRMLSDADDALYASKRAGRGQSQFYAPPEGDRRRA